MSERPRRAGRRFRPISWAVSAISGNMYSTLRPARSSSAISRMYISVLPLPVTPCSNTTSFPANSSPIRSKQRCCAGVSSGRRNRTASPSLPTASRRTDRSRHLSVKALSTAGEAVSKRRGTNFGSSKSGGPVRSRYSVIARYCPRALDSESRAACKSASLRTDGCSATKVSCGGE